MTVAGKGDVDLLFLIDWNSGLVWGVKFDIEDRVLGSFLFADLPLSSRGLPISLLLHISTGWYQYHQVTYSHE